VSRDATLYVADIVAAGEGHSPLHRRVTFEAFAANDEKRAAVERQVLASNRCASRCVRDSHTETGIERP
jgi:uncharacterized protein with HEPN domain